MKKLLFFLLTAGVFTLSAHAQNWVGFSGSKPGAPQINLLNSNNQSVSFEITIPGIYTVDTVVKGVAFTRLMLPGGGAVNPAGSPEIPVLVYKVAVPECAGIDVTYQVYSRQNLPDCWVYPVPEFILDGNETLVEQFYFNPNAYAQPHVPEPVAGVSSTGALRAQRYVEVRIQPVEFCPVKKQLSVIEKMEVTLNFNKPKSELLQNVGIFNKVAAKAFINYEDNGMSAIINDKAFEREKYTKGHIRHYPLTDTAQACQIEADYLIITEVKLFDSPALKELMHHRAYYNGFDVAIVITDQILLLPFQYEGNDDPLGEPDEYIKEQKLRTFIRRVYEGQNAQHTGDGSLAYVLLVGDDGMPTSYDHDAWTVDGPGNDVRFASDYYFSCVTRDVNGSYDNIGDLFIGRLSAINEEHLHNMVQKTINHETEYSPQVWRKTAGFTYMDPLTNTSPDYGTWYCHVMGNLLDNCGWNSAIVNGNEEDGAFEAPTLNYLNAGTTFVQYYGNGTKNSWTSNSSTFHSDHLSTTLHNAYKAPFKNAVSNCTGRFYVGSIGEFLMRYDPVKGAVGYIGTSGVINFNSIVNDFSTFQVSLPNHLFNDNISIAGELLLASKLSNTQPSTINQYKHAFNLLGCPALNIFAEGYEITREVVAECPIEISHRVRTHNGGNLIIPDNCTVNFYPEGELLIESYGNLTVGNQVLFNGIDNEIDATVHVRGGGFTMGSGVTFQNLPGGVVLGNEHNITPWFHTTRQYNLSHATFTNTPLTHRGSRLNISNCTFNPGSDVKTYVSISTVNNCTFNQTTFLSDHTNMLGGFTPATAVSNNNFTGNNSHTALQLKNSKGFNIQNNTITGYGTGISMHACGETQSGFLTTVTLIRDNEISNCGTGIELYNSIATFRGNHIENSGFGVRLFNNSYTSFGTTTEPAASQYQTIQNCSSIEFYACATSFPTSFRYNQVIDDNNLGNTHNDPLVWWDVPSRVLPRDVMLNCWGENFDPVEDFYPFSAFSYLPIWLCLIPDGAGAQTQNTDETLYQTGLDYFANEDYHNAGLVFKELVEAHPQSRFAIAALHELFALEGFKDNDFTALHNYFAAITPEDSNLFNTADFLATRCHVKDKNWQPAIDWYEHRIENPPSYQDSVFAVIDLGNIHLMMEAEAAADTMNGNGEYSRIMYRYRSDLKPQSKKEYGEKKTALLATLPQIKKPGTDQPQTGKPQTDVKGALGQNIPNPATGITTIGYDIYTGGVVEIKIYNVLGQVMQTLPQGRQQPGSYQAKVTVSGMPAGMYHYALFVNGEKADTKKMVVN